jgi:hypothetical protein
VTEQRNDDGDVPNYLVAPPEGEHPDPPVDTAGQVLPFGELAWEDFERLCYRLARDDGEPERVAQFGTKGQAQSGIDIYSRQSDGTYVTYQCKRYASFREGDIEQAIATFESGPWSASSTRFVLCISASTIRTQLAGAIESAAMRLRARHPPVNLDVWDAEELAVRLRRHPELVREFFGPAWSKRFIRTPESSSPVVPLLAVAEELARRIHLSSWEMWTEGLFEPRPRIHISVDGRLQEVQGWLAGRVIGNDSSPLGAALLNLARVLVDFQLALNYDMDDRNDFYWVAQFYRAWDGYAGRREQVERYQAHIALIKNLAAEMSRAMNLIIDRARAVDALAFHGVPHAVIMAGPEHERAVVPTYSESERAAAQPYPGLDGFPSALPTRADGSFGVGSSPEAPTPEDLSGWVTFLQKQRGSGSAPPPGSDT